jgi:FkbM family methyltransferase
MAIKRIKTNSLPKTEQDLFQQELDTLHNHTVAFEQTVQAPGVGNYFRRRLHTIVSSYLITQSKLNTHIESLIRYLLRKQAEVVDSIEALQEKNNFIETVHLKSYIAEANAMKEKHAYLMNIVLKAEKSFIGLGQQFQRAFYSQFGEDEWIVNNILDLPKRGFFIEVGVADGITFSNTYYFEKLGWKGLCFEPNPYQYAQAKLYRKHVEPIAVTKRDEQVELHISKSFPDWSSIVASDDSQEIITVPGKSLRTIISENKIKAIDVLSIDVEGAELDVLEGLPFDQLQPRIIIVEFMNKLDQKNDNVEKFMATHPYRLAHRTFANCIYVRRELLNQI